ncbi:conserved hypothetical protein [Vibrio owensii]|uniref:Uncharacterized protein n=1 Tax=Vibrio owensii TaxID=696485 RepID=A0AAU9PYV3_9VIBR|nr:conserved hypothetical protein [Vibrio owensii]
MFRKKLHEELRAIFQMNAVDWAGELHKGGGHVYVEYLNVREQNFSESHIRFFGTIRLSIADTGRDDPLFGVLSSRFDAYKKRSDSTIALASVNTEAFADWLSVGTFSVSKEFYFACEIEFDKTREKIKEFKWIEYE